MSDETPRYQDDLYNAVNGEWAKTAVIPDDKATTGGFQDLADEVEKTLMADFDAVADGSKKSTDGYFTKAVELYKVASNFAKRDADGIAPELKRLHKIQALTSLADFNAQAGQLALNGFVMPVDVDVDADMKDTSHNSVVLTGPSTILPDTTYYAEGNEQGKQLLATWRTTTAKLLAETDLSEKEQAEYLDATLAFDAEIAKRVKSSEEWADYPACYNPIDLTEAAKKTDSFDLVGFLNDTMPALPNKVIAYDPRFLDEAATLFNADTFASYKAWAYVKDLLGHTGYLSDELRVAGGAYGRALSGLAAAPSKEKSAYRLANSYFAEPIGVYYGQTYFGEEAKADVTKMVERMIATYKDRLQKNEWLSESTSQKAIVKLDKMVLKMGYPDKVDAMYDTFTVDPDASLLENVVAISAAKRQWQFNKLTKPVDRTEWAMPGHLVNACYDPSRNDITFPAAILQAPFYSLKQSSSENFGGIGAVIAHEISHGFDNNGAQFDEYGNLNKWWQDDDYKKFNDLTQEMIAEFDGIEFAGGKVNGKLIVSENIADAGGLSAALTTAKQEPDVDLKAFFTNWARIWRMKERTEYAQLLLSIDVHAPHYLRANIQPRNLDDWYTTFDVKPDDGMYLEPEKRITIW
ncbi:M13 family metallopeptidase [Lacticaseibacillus hulanensis]|uniref:M13 family metallopeptidase n=1 Tax=Lacticaseibacillus hulanensis TaxID=2493111 RepID=UPI000FD9376F|nr:M13-type metalloendopeptidase [Lacticaseibacillus hulanensis]